MKDVWSFLSLLQRKMFFHYIALDLYFSIHWLLLLLSFVSKMGKKKEKRNTDGSGVVYPRKHFEHSVIKLEEILHFLYAS